MAGPPRSQLRGSGGFSPRFPTTRHSGYSVRHKQCQHSRVTTQRVGEHNFPSRTVPIRLRTIQLPVHICLRLPATDKKSGDRNCADRRTLAKDWPPACWRNSSVVGHEPVLRHPRQGAREARNGHQEERRQFEPRLCGAQCAAVAQEVNTEVTTKNPRSATKQAS